MKYEMTVIQVELTDVLLTAHQLNLTIFAQEVPLLLKIHVQHAILVSFQTMQKTLVFQYVETTKE